MQRRMSRHLCGACLTCPPSSCPSFPCTATRSAVARNTFNPSWITCITSYRLQVPFIAMYRKEKCGELLATRDADEPGCTDRCAFGGSFDPF